MHQTYWQKEAPASFAAQRPAKHYHVVVIGAGITGLTAAWLLKRSGRQVAVFDKGRVGSGETSRTSGHLTQVTDLLLSELVDRFGEHSARLAWTAGETAIDLIDSICEALDPSDCGFVRVPNFLSLGLEQENADAEALRKELEIAQRLGFDATFVSQGPFGRPAVRYPDQAIVHPLAYLQGLAHGVHGDGSLVSEDSEVVEVIDDPLAVIVNGEIVGCDYLIIATHVPLAGKTGMLRATLFQTKLYPYSSYVIGARLPTGRLPPLLCSDTDDPYNYLRVHEDEDGLFAILGGADHKTGQADDPDASYGTMERRLHALFPEATVEDRWSGQVVESADGLPFIGETSERQFVATGYAGNGLTFGTLAGLMAHDAALGIANPWRELFRPARKTAGALGTLLAENVDYPYHFIADRLRRLPRSAHDLRAGEGALIRQNGTRVAAFRRSDGRLVQLNPSCTHMGCLVRWNATETTWDCPCHGSRFSAEGEVIGGPAEEPLAPIAD